MGCLNATKNPKWHWFGNIHLSGPCTRKCYFCIGQHMMALDKLNTLHSWPLPGLIDFKDECLAHAVREIFITGSNTDPLLYDHTIELTSFLKELGFIVGVRTNGIGDLRKLSYYQKGSLTVCSLSNEINQKMMGGPPPVVNWVMDALPNLKINMVLGPENFNSIIPDVITFENMGITRVNLREPYGQPHVGNLLKEKLLLVLFMVIPHIELVEP